jgi:hypothetical protein
MAIYCSQGHPNPDGDDFQRNCQVCGQDMFSATLLSNPAPVPSPGPVGPGYITAPPRPISMAYYGEDIRRSRSAATWSLVLGILGLAFCGFFTGIPAIVMGNKARRLAPPGLGTGIAIAGITLGWVSVAFGVIGVIVMLNAASSAH